MKGGKGHRCAGTMCDVCSVINALQSALYKAMKALEAAGLKDAHKAAKASLEESHEE